MLVSRSIAAHLRQLERTTGVEPASDWLEASSLTIRPNPHKKVSKLNNLPKKGSQAGDLEQAAGVEPTPEGLEHLCTIHCATLACGSFVMLLSTRGLIFGEPNRKAYSAGVEPAPNGFGVRYATIYTKSMYRSGFNLRRIHGFSLLTLESLPQESNLPTMVRSHVLIR